MKLKGILAKSGLTSKLFLLIGTSLFLACAATILLSTAKVTNLKSIQFIESISLFILPAYIVTYLYSINPSKKLRINKLPIGKDLLLMGLLIIVLIPFINMLSEWNKQIVLPSFLSDVEKWMKTTEENANQLTDKFLNVTTWSGLWINLILMAAIPAIGEEFFFRGVVQNSIGEKFRINASVWVTAILFSAIHLQFYGFFPRLILGVLLGYSLVWSNNLWIPIFAHFVNNGMAVMYSFLKFNHFRIINLETIGTGSTLWLGVLSGITSLLWLIMIRKHLTIHQNI